MPTIRKTFTLNNGKTIEYKEFGTHNLPVVLIMHGIAGDGIPNFINKFFEHLPFRFVSILRPGYGKSDMFIMTHIIDWAKELLPLFNHLNITSFDVIGMSAGAPYAYSMAEVFPKMTKRIFILSGIPALYNKEVMASLSWFSRKYYRNLMKKSLKKVARNLMILFFFTPNKVKKEIGFDDAKVNGGFGMAREVKLYLIHWGFELDDIKHPITIIHSKADDNVPFAAVQKTVKLLIPNAKFIILDNEKHVSEYALKVTAKYLNT